MIYNSRWIQKGFKQLWNFCLQGRMLSDLNAKILNTDESFFKEDRIGTSEENFWMRGADFAFGGQCGVFAF